MNKDIIRRICETGPTYASLHELLTAIVGDSNTAPGVLTCYPSVLELAAAHDADLQKLCGVGPAPATRLKAAFELGRRLNLAEAPERTIIRAQFDAANLFMSEMGLLEQEEMRVLMLDTRNGIIAMHTAYKGSLNSTLIRIADIFREPIRRNAAAIIVAHNHPSGDPNPSPEDVSVTRNIILAGQQLDIDLLDHVVIGRQRFVSLKERGLAFS